MGPLVRALESEDWHVRQQAARILGEIGDSRAAEAAVQDPQG